MRRLCRHLSSSRLSLTTLSQRGVARVESSFTQCGPLDERLVVSCCALQIGPAAPRAQRGVRLAGVERGSVLAPAEVRRGSHLLSVNGIDISRLPFRDARAFLRSVQQMHRVLVFLMPTEVRSARSSASFASRGRRDCLGMEE